MTFALFGCGDASLNAYIKKLKDKFGPPPPALPQQVIIEGNSEAGNGPPVTSANFVLIKSTVGGSVEKTKASSASFRVTGGVYGGL